MGKTPLYKSSYNKNVVMYDIYPPIPLKGFDDEKELSLNLKLGEVRNSSYLLDDEHKDFRYIPIDTRLIEAFQILRDALAKPIRLNSSFRSVGHELSKGRKGTSKHCDGQAFDLSGEGLVELLKDALATKNKLYQRLRAIGVNGFGIYELQGFIHIDVREPKSDGGYAFWSHSDDLEIKKKDKSTLIKVVLLPIAFVLVAVGIYKRFKDWRR